MINATAKKQAPIEPLQVNKWAALRHEIQVACNRNWTKEEIHLYECLALSSWEIR